METDVRIPMTTCAGCGDAIGVAVVDLGDGVFCSPRCKRLLGKRIRMKQWRSAHPELDRQRKRDSYQKHKARTLARQKQYYENNKQARREYNRSYREKDVEAARARKRLYYVRNREKCIVKIREWCAAHRDITYTYSRNRGMRKIRAIPVWLTKNDHKKINDLYRLAADATKRTGTRHVVDHIVPLRNPMVCGLHWQINLRVVPWRVNSRKSNKHVHNEPIQLSLLAA